MTKALIRLLGSISTTFFLLGLAAVAAIAGTILEASRGSHLWASLWTYDNPIFQVLFWGFTINITFATFKRWPFRWRHLPFLSAHLGLLLLLAGGYVKAHFGIQGTLMLPYNSIQNEITIPHSHALFIKSRTNSIQIPLKNYFLGQYEWKEEAVKVTVEDFLPHAEEKWTLVWPETPAIDGWHLYEPKMPSCTLPNSEEVLFVSYDGQEKIFPTKHLILSESLALENGFGGYYVPIIPPPHFVPKNAFKAAQKALRAHLAKEISLWPILLNPQEESEYLKDFLPLQEPLFYAALSRHITPASLPVKMEEQTPALALHIEHLGVSRPFPLVYRPNAPFFWPTPCGTFQLAFGPQKVTLPFSLKLISAQKVTYPATEQVYSFECSIEIIELNRSTVHWLSMQDVLELQDGTRLYLSHMSLAPNQQPLVQLTINRDLGRYWLTYPGILFVTLGAAMLVFHLLVKRKK